ncbi:MAG TPA: nucleotidyltransferase family protein, partial [Acidimicrobiales bacterium]|nr:nucleotidyltransferase family protein [Acidimicrobiales bacterium]
MGDPIAIATAVAGYGLGPPGVPLVDEPLDARSWSELMTLLQRQRLIGLFSAAVSECAIAVTAEQKDELSAVEEATVSKTLEVERDAIEIVDALANAKIKHRILKGPAVAHLDYPDPQRRPYEVVNLLVPMDRYDDAVELIMGRGCRRSVPEPRPGFDRRFGKGTTLLSDDGRVVELHRTIVTGPYAMLTDPNNLFDTSTALELHGHELCALGLEERLLHACFDARIGDDPPLLLRLRDIVQLALTNQLDIPHIESISDAWKAQSVVAEAIHHAWETLSVVDIVPLSAWAAGHKSSRTDRRRLSAYRKVRGRTLVSVPTVRDIRPRRAIVPYLRAVLLPDRRYLEGRYRGHAHRWWRGSLVMIRRHDHR